MRLASIVLATSLLAVSANAATFHVDTDSSVYSAVPGTIATVTVTLTTVAEIVHFASFGITIGWDPTVVKVAGSNPPATFGKSAQSAILPGFSGTLTPFCAFAGPTKGKVCTVITQSNVSGGPIAVSPGQVVIGTLLLEVVAGAVPGSDLGLAITAYANNTLFDPDNPVPADTNRTVTANFVNAHLTPEPSTASLLAVGLVGLGLAGRHSARELTR